MCFLRKAHGCFEEMMILMVNFAIPYYAKHLGLSGNLMFIMTILTMLSTKVFDGDELA